MPQIRRASTAVIAEVNPRAIAHYREMRSVILDVPAADRAMCELVITCQLALLGHEVPFKIHALRMRDFNVSKTQIQQAILAGVGVTCVMCEAAQAIEWLNQAYDETSESAA
jgi:hypothetical protein